MVVRRKITEFPLIVSAMNTAQPTEPQLPSAAETELARTSSRTLAAIVGPARAERLRLVVDDETIEVPVSAMKLFAEVLSQMGLGRAVQIVPHNAELTTQQAADFLNVSRPFLIKRLEAGELPFHMTGSHRRIFFQDVLVYREQLHRSQKSATDELLEVSAHQGWTLDP